MKLGDKWEGENAAVRLRSLRKKGTGYCSKIVRGGSQTELEINSQQIFEEYGDDSKLGDGVACVGDNA